MRNGKGFPHPSGLRTGGAPDWDRLLLSDPDRVVEALRDWLGPQRPTDPEVEHGYWELLLSRCTPEELAEAVLDRLDLDRDPLLDVTAADLRRLQERLEAAARERLDRLDLPDEERGRVVKHAFLLAETACESQGHLPLAAALYALTHDARAGEDTFSLYERVLLRFKLGGALLLLDERVDARRRCISMVRSAAERAEELQAADGAPRDALRALLLEIRIWLGHRQEELDDFTAAADSFLAAVAAAGTIDDRVTCAARAASALAACGQLPKARAVLLSVEGEVGQVEDGMVRELWEAVLWSLGEG